MTPCHVIVSYIYIQTKYDIVWIIYTDKEINIMNEQDLKEFDEWLLGLIKTNGTTNY